MYTLSTSNVHPFEKAVVSSCAHAMLGYTRRVHASDLPDSRKEQILACIMPQMEVAVGSPGSREEQKMELRRRIEQFHRGIDAERERAALKETGKERAAMYPPWFQSMTTLQRQERQRTREAGAQASAHAIDEQGDSVREASSSSDAKTCANDEAVSMRLTRRIC